ncbi:MAG TPA: hypothetical protein VMD30_10210, partial [Tepidisphaeraceae bacterium]|nr:hypothetical protein [Tepidisphaeraceae bacterium]
GHPLNPDELKQQRQAVSARLTADEQAENQASDAYLQAVAAATKAEAQLMVAQDDREKLLTFRQQQTQLQIRKETLAERLDRDRQAATTAMTVQKPDPETNVQIVQDEENRKGIYIGFTSLGLAVMFCIMMAVLSNPRPAPASPQVPPTQPPVDPVAPDPFAMPAGEAEQR